MKQIYFATTNKGKVNHLNAALKQYGIDVQHAAIELPEPRSDDLRVIAREKVMFAFETLRKPCVALDSGFYVQALNGFPRAFVNFALQTIGLEGILKLVEQKPRTCEFRNCLAYFDGTLSEPTYFESSSGGILANESRGRRQERAWSDLNLIFIPDGKAKTLAEMSEEEYLQWRKEREGMGESFAAKFGKWYSFR